MSKIVHFEIPAEDPRRAVAFYRDVLGWEVSQFGAEPYWLVRAGADDEPGANGALLGKDALHQSPVVIAGVDSIDEALGRVVKSGGDVIQGKLPVPGMGWSAYVHDPEGNTIGLFQQDPGAGG
jgi:predicted enzyme related to lactoylglutathione lyase